MYVPEDIQVTITITITITITSKPISTLKKYQ